MNDIQKKGAQAQKQIQLIQSQASQAQTPEQKRKAAEKAQREKEKAASETAKKEAAELFKPVHVQKVPFGVDPKTVVCTFYKQGNCEKGKKCKFSHDLSVERKGEKKDLYQDTREVEEEAKKKDDMTDWDEGTISLPPCPPSPLSLSLSRTHESSPSHEYFYVKAKERQAHRLMFALCHLQQNSAKSFSQNTGTPKPRRTKYANTSSRPLKKENTAGSGPAPTAAINACTSTPSPPDSPSRQKNNEQPRKP